MFDVLKSCWIALTAPWKEAYPDPKEFWIELIFVSIIAVCFATMAWGIFEAPTSGF